MPKRRINLAKNQHEFAVAKKNYSYFKIIF